jgi:signal transduction histidine kinase
MRNSLAHPVERTVRGGRECGSPQRTVRRNPLLRGAVIGHHGAVRGRSGGRGLVVLGGASVLALPVVGHLGHQPGWGWANLPLTAVYFGTGAVAFLQRPDNPAARRLLGFGCSVAVAFAVGYGYSAFVVLAGVPSWSGAMAVVLKVLAWSIDASALAMAAVFPDGSYQRRYERTAVRTTWSALGVLVLAEVLGSEHLSVNTPYVWPGVAVAGTNALAVPAVKSLGPVGDVGLDSAEALLPVAAVLLVLRYRRATPDQRRQIAWPLYALGMTVVGLTFLGAVSGWINHQPYWLGFLFFYPVLLLLPVGLLIGMRRHQLLDINLVVRRSVVYGTLWTLITVGYVAVAGAFGVLVGQRVPLQLAVVLTILATIVAAPVRRRLERVADRLVYGPRSSGYELISRLGARLEASVASEDVAGAVASAVHDGLGSRWVRVVLAGTGVVATAGRSDPDDVPLLVAPLGSGEGAVGAIECGPKVEGRYRPSDEELLRTLGRQATLALGNAALTVELSERLSELAASRARLVEAEEAGRRRIERDLHDGVQQELVALLTRVSMAADGRRAARCGGGVGHADADRRGGAVGGLAGRLPHRPGARGRRVLRGVRGGRERAQARTGVAVVDRARPARRDARRRDRGRRQGLPCRRRRAAGAAWAPRPGRGPRRTAPGGQRPGVRHSRVRRAAGAGGSGCLTGCGW